MQSVLQPRKIPELNVFFVFLFLNESATLASMEASVRRREEKSYRGLFRKVCVVLERKERPKLSSLFLKPDFIQILGNFPRERS